MNQEYVAMLRQKQQSSRQEDTASDINMVNMENEYPGEHVGRRCIDLTHQ